MTQTGSDSPATSDCNTLSSGSSSSSLLLNTTTTSNATTILTPSTPTHTPSSSTPLPEGSFAWTPQLDVYFFEAIRGMKPVGVNKHFYMVTILNRFHRFTQLDVSAQTMWDRLYEFYNLEHVTDNEAFDKTEQEFTLEDNPDFRELLGNLGNGSVQGQKNQNYPRRSMDTTISDVLLPSCGTSEMTGSEVGGSSTRGGDDGTNDSDSSDSSVPPPPPVVVKVEVQQQNTIKSPASQRVAKSRRQSTASDVSTTPSVKVEVQPTSTRKRDRSEASEREHHHQPRSSSTSRYSRGHQQLQLSEVKSEDEDKDQHHRSKVIDHHVTPRSGNHYTQQQHHRNEQSEGHPERSSGPGRKPYKQRGGGHHGQSTTPTSRGSSMVAKKRDLRERDSSVNSSSSNKSPRASGAKEIKTESKDRDSAHERHRGDHTPSSDRDNHHRGDPHSYRGGYHSTKKRKNSAKQ